MLDWRTTRSLGTSLVLALGIIVACTAETDIEPLDPAEPGATQPDGGGTPIDEAEACAALRKALLDATDRLKCDDREVLDCPELIRPFGSDPCQRYQYDEESVESCVEVVEDYARCEDFDRSACIVTAIVRDDADCDPRGEGGAAGASGGTGGNSGGQAGAAGGGGAP